MPSGRCAKCRRGQVERIMIPSAGAASSVSVIKEARKRGHWVLATDLNEYAPGMLLASDCWVSEMCYESTYVPNVIGMCLDEDITWIIPINDVELPIYVANREKFLDAGIVPLMNPNGCVLDGCSKLRSWIVCEQAGIRQPPSYFQDAFAWDKIDSLMPPPSCFPIIAKPPMCVGGRGQVVCNSAEDVKRLIASSDSLKLSQYLWQQYIYGTEYSVDCWGDPNTDLFVAVPRTRGKIINGQATGGVTQYAPDVVDFVREICKAFGSNNVCCVQVIRGNDGALYFIEFNPRYGTGVSLSFEAGINFLDLQFRQAHGRPIARDMLTYEAGVGMARFWQERFYRDNTKGKHRWVANYE